PDIQEALLFRTRPERGRDLMHRLTYRRRWGSQGKRNRTHKPSPTSTVEILSHVSPLLRMSLSPRRSGANAAASSRPARQHLAKFVAMIRLVGDEGVKLRCQSV